MAEREQMLATFQDCTGNDDIEECIAILEQHDWNLMQAVQNAMAGLESPLMETAPPLSEGPPAFAMGTGISVGPSPLTNPSPVIFPPLSRASPPRYDLTSESGSGEGLIVSGASNPAVAQASTSSGIMRNVPRMLHFNVEFRDKNIKLVVSDSERVVRLKELIESDMSIPVARQQLGGWVHKNDRHIDDQDVLKDLKLPKENTLFLLAPDIPELKTADVEDNELLMRLSKVFTLNIHYTDNNQFYTLNFPGSKTIQEVKSDVYSITSVPVRHQLWSGWPEAAKDETMTLAGCGVNHPTHDLQFRKVAEDDRKNRTKNENKLVKAKDAKVVVDDSDDAQSDEMIEISDDDFEDAHDNFNLDEDIFAPDVSTARRPQPLMPEQVSDQTTALEHFTQEFEYRYGECHPVFYVGTLEDAIKDALCAKAKDRKLLAIYLHHDSSILSNVFCSQILCSESVVSYLSSNFLTWAWDLTSDANRAMLLTMCTHHFGSVAANTVRNFKPDELPLLLIISRNRSTNEVCNVIQANMTLDELMTQLIQAVEVFHEQQEKEIIEEREREAREQMKQEQDMAYQESLAVDKAKAEQRQKEEEERRNLEIVEDMKRQEAEEKRREEEEEKEAIRQSILCQLPEEPAENCGEPMAKIRFRLPDGEMVTRRFLAQNPLQILLNFVASRGYSSTEYKVLTTFPRRDLTQLDSSLTLEVLKLYPQETVILEERVSD